MRKLNKQVPSNDMSDTQSHLDGDRDFGKGERVKRIRFQSNNQKIIMTLLIESGRLGWLGRLYYVPVFSLLTEYPLPFWHAQHRHKTRGFNLLFLLCWFSSICPWFTWLSWCGYFMRTCVHGVYTPDQNEIFFSRHGKKLQLWLHSPQCLKVIFSFLGGYAII